MSIAALSVAEAALAAQPADTKDKKPPRTRQVVAKTDANTAPEPR